jgi:hypothetical protein
MAMRAAAIGLEKAIYMSEGETKDPVLTGLRQVRPVTSWYFSEQAFRGFQPARLAARE